MFGNGKMMTPAEFRGKKKDNMGPLKSEIAFPFTSGCLTEFLVSIHCNLKSDLMFSSF
jgi:hypothetical protein